MGSRISYTKTFIRGERPGTEQMGCTKSSACVWEGGSRNRYRPGDLYSGEGESEGEGEGEGELVRCLAASYLQID